MRKKNLVSLVMSVGTFVSLNFFHKKVTSNAGYAIAYYGFGSSGGGG